MSSNSSRKKKKLSYLLLQRLWCSLPHHSIRRLQLQQSVEKIIWGHCQELNFCIRVQPIMHRALMGQHLIYEIMVALEMWGENLLLPFILFEAFKSGNWTFNLYLSWESWLNSLISQWWLVVAAFLFTPGKCSSTLKWSAYETISRKCSLWSVSSYLIVQVGGDDKPRS